jgi:hypothetical protein
VALLTFGSLHSTVIRIIAPLGLLAIGPLILFDLAITPPTSSPRLVAVTLSGSSEALVVRPVFWRFDLFYVDVRKGPYTVLGLLTFGHRTAGLMVLAHLIRNVKPTQD